MLIQKRNIARVFAPLLMPARYKGAYGGRGSGKSHFFGEQLVEDCLQQRGLLAVCIREVQKTLAQSSKRLIEHKIKTLGASREFRVFKDRIETPGGGLIIFTGMQDRAVNNSARQVLADMRSMANDLVWFAYGIGDGPVAHAYASATSTIVAGANVTAVYHAGRRVRAVGATTGTIYGSISSSSYSAPNTTVNYTWDSGSLANESLVISISQSPVTGAPVGQNCIPGLQAGTINWVAAGGTADAITATYSPALTALGDGQFCFVRASAANATTAPTFAPNGLTAHTITKKGGAPLAVGDIPAALAEIILRYNLANTRWELINPAASSEFTSGTFTPTDNSGASLSLTTNFVYRKHATFYLFWGELTYPSTANGNGAALAGLPFTSKSNTFAVAGWYTPINFTNGSWGGALMYLSANQNATTGTFRDAGGTQPANSVFSTWRMYLIGSVPL